MFLVHHIIYPRQSQPPTTGWSRRTFFTWYDARKDRRFSIPGRA